jgi:hypothetical protein
VKLLVSLIVISSLSLGAQTSYKLSLISVTSCAFADGVSTQQAIQRGARETNPLMVSHPIIVKSVVFGSWMGLNWIFRKKNKKPLEIGNWIMAGSWCGAAAWNSTLNR